MSAFQHPEPIAEYIEKELKRSRTLGPFPVGGRLQSAIQISRFGVIPKGHNEGKWRLITDLSYPTGHSVNDGINPALCSLRYTTVEIVASEAAALGPGALIAKVDIESAYRLVPVHPDDRSLLGLRLGDKLYIDPDATIWSPIGTKNLHGEVGELRLPDDKVVHLRSLVADWAGRKACNRKELESLVGHLNHACKVVRPGRSFLRRMIALLQRQYRNKYHPIRLNHGFRSDLHWWASFAAQWNGASGQQGACSCATGGCRPFAGPGGGLDLALQSGCGSSALFSPRLSLINAQVIRLGLRRFYSFCTKYDVFTPFPVTEKLLCYFAAALANEGLAPQTIKCYLSGVRSMQISLGLPPPRDQSSLPILKRVLDGIRRSTAAQAGGRPRKIRLPITAAVLRGIQGPLSLRMGQDSTAFWAIAVVAFFGFFRLGELLLESRTTYNSVLHLSWGDISIDSLTNPSMVEVYLKKSKCDQFGAGADVLLGRSGGQLCPVTAILDYINVRRDTPGYFFVESQEKPISKARFIAGLREALKESGYPDDQYAGHSFCIGAATAAAIAGVEDSLIQTLGRWHSAAFLRYFRTPHDQLAPN
ncbi:hypothetical protein EMCRGX_G017678 [Ephydatia muelleri]